ncbi:thioredoxin family protein [Maridesulfovibrio zosterae]|uniref:thioredoxin family protein n=1 Tax=Maridesulfovibrio zosterae TaxID=82171 RepID=UPI0004894850|nr:thioredoxin domain-containing protein [Maridesulfovibrio zosterae]
MSSNVIEVTTATWDREVKDAGCLVVILFWAPWCEPCSSMLSVMENLAEEYAGKTKFVTLNIDENDEMASAYRISILPTIIYVRGEQKLHDFITVVPKDSVENSIKALGGA